MRETAASTKKKNYACIVLIILQQGFDYLNQMLKLFNLCVFLPSLSYLPLPDQLSLQVIDLDEGSAGADGTDRPDRPHRPPGKNFDLFRHPVPKAAPPVNVAAAHGEGLVQAVVQRWHAGRLQVRVGLGSDWHFQAETACRSAKTLALSRWRSESRQGLLGGGCKAGRRPRWSSQFHEEFTGWILSPSMHHLLFIR